MWQERNKVYVLGIYAVLALATIIAFEQVWRNEFVGYDDDVYVTENTHVNGGITRQSVIWAFTTPHHYMWHPLTSLSHMLDCQLFGLNPVGHHLTSLLLHIASGLLLFWILKRMTGAIWLSGFVAAVFAVHPLQVESVAWVAERKNVLCGFFWMLTIAAYIRYVERPRIGRYLLVVLVFFLGLMAKPMAVTLPFVLLLLDYWPLCRLRRARQNESEDLPQSKSEKAGYQSLSLRGLVAEKIPLFILAAILSVITFIAQQRGGTMTAIEHLPLNIRIANALVSYLSYIGKMVYPSGLAVLYPHRNDDLMTWQPIVCFIILAVVSAGIIHIARRRRFLAAGWLWYLGTLVPVIGLVQVGGQAMADRYTYLPSIGIFIMVAWGAAELPGRWRYRKIGLGITAGVILVALLICTRMQMRYWRDDFALFGHAIEVTKDNAVMHNNFGNALHDKGLSDEAIKHFDKALRISPLYYKAHYNKGMVFADLGKINEAISIFTEVTRLKKDWPDVYNNLGLAYAQKGRLDLAIQNYNEALRLKPDYPIALNNLGAALKEQGKINEAIEKWEKALQLKPDQPNAHFNMGLVAAQRGKYDDAVKYFNEALRAKSDWPEVHYNLGGVYCRQGKLDKAVEQCVEALRIKPDYLKARISLAHTLVELGRIQPALEHYYKIVQLKPDEVEVLNDLAWILATTGDENLRSPADAVKFARQACELSNYKQPEILNTLAAAYAVGDRFPEAIETAEKAIKLAGPAGKKELAEKTQKHLELYKAGRAYIERPVAQDNQDNAVP